MIELYPNHNLILKVSINKYPADNVHEQYHVHLDQSITLWWLVYLNIVWHTPYTSIIWFFFSAGHMCINRAYYQYPRGLQTISKGCRHLQANMSALHEYKSTSEKVGKNRYTLLLETMYIGHGNIHLGYIYWYIWDSNLHVRKYQTVIWTTETQL